MTPPPSQESPPRRAALHERTDSQANRRPPPSLRVVGQPEASIYDTTPFPTKPSQVLRPSREKRGRGQISNGSPSPAYPPNGNSWGASSLLFACNNQLRGPGSEAQRSSDISFYSTSTDDSVSRPDVQTSSSFLTDANEEDAGEQSAEEEPNSNWVKDRSSPEPIAQLPSIPPRAEGHTIPPALKPAPLQTSPADRQPANKESDGSLSSTNSTGTVIVKKPRDGRKRASYSAFPFIRPSSSKSNVSIITTPQTARKPSDDSEAPPSPISPSSPVSAAYTPSAVRQASSRSASDVSDEESDSTRLQYPIVRGPQVSASWAQTSSAPPSTSAPAPDRLVERWNPHLSTVHSEGTGSYSGERSSQATGLINSVRVSDSSSNVRVDPRWSTEYPPIPRRSLEPHATTPEHNFTTLPGPQDSSFPLPATLRPRDASGPSIRLVKESDEHEGATGERAERPERSRNASGHTIRLVNSDEESSTAPSAEQNSQASQLPTESEVVLRNPTRRPQSRASMLRDGLPAWARYFTPFRLMKNLNFVLIVPFRSYYSRPESATTFSRDSRRYSISTENISLNAFRNHPGQGVKKPRELRRSRMRIGDHQIEHEHMPHQPALRRFSPTWTPHLWHHRTSIVKRRTVFITPSLDERQEGLSLNRRNVQIACFVIGFILPPCKSEARLAPDIF